MDRLPPTERDSFDGLLEKAKSTGESFSYMMQMPDESGQIRFAELKCEAVRGHSNTIEGLRGTLQDVTEQQRMLAEINERKLAEERIRDSEERFRWTFEQAAVGIIHTSFDGRFLRGNERFAQIIGYPLTEAMALGFQDITPAEDIEATWRLVDLLRNGKSASASLEKRVIRKDGSLSWVKVTSSVQRDADHNPLHLITLVEDINERKQAKEAQRLASLVYDTSSEAMIVTDPDGTIISVNPAFTNLTLYSSQEAVGQKVKILNSGQQDEIFYKELWDTLNATGRWHGEIWNRRKSGEIFLERLTINTIYDDKGRVFRRIGLFSDITEQKKSQDTIWQQANFDWLTGLPNRRMFHDRLDQEIKKSHRTQSPLALMFIDMDRFKEVNDTLGHEKGDLLLRQVSQRLQSCVRESDTIGRLGGDEFTVILSDFTEIKNIDRIAETILQKLAEPYHLNEDTAYATASVGITLYPDDASDIDGLLKNADQAMYESKHLGRNRFNYFKPSMQEAALNRVKLTNDLRVALNGQQFVVYYQPIVTLATGEIAKAEALIRWNHPKLGLVSPDEFIPIAEETGMIIEIGEWVFRQAAQQAARWLNFNGVPIQISINKSPVQFQENSHRHREWYSHLLSLESVREVI